MGKEEGEAQAAGRAGLHGQFLGSREGMQGTAAHRRGPCSCHWTVPAATDRCFLPSLLLSEEFPEACVHLRGIRCQGWAVNYAAGESVMFGEGWGEAASAGAAGEGDAVAAVFQNVWTGKRVQLHKTQ